MNATSKTQTNQTGKSESTARTPLETSVLSDGFLARLEKSVPWEEFRSTLEETKEEETAGRKGYDKLTLFKCLIIQEAYGLSDKALESALKDRLSFRFFTGIDLSPSVPDRLTIMRFRNRLATNDLQRRLFARFYSSLEERGLSIYSGTNANVSYAKTPRLRRTKTSQNEDRSICSDVEQKPNVLKWETT